MTNDLYLTQEALEKESRALTIQRFEAQLTERKQKEEETATYYGAPLMKRAIEPLAEAIDAKIAEANSGRSGPRMTAIPTLEQFDSKVVAFFTAKTIIDKLTSRTNKLQSVAVMIGKNLEDELRYTSFQEQHPWLLRDRTLCLHTIATVMCGPAGLRLPTCMSVCC